MDLATTEEEAALEVKDDLSEADGRTVGGAAATATRTAMIIPAAVTIRPAIREEAGSNVAAISIIGPGPTEKRKLSRVVLSSHYFSLGHCTYIYSWL
jgi:hypothetical protein